MGLFLMLSGIAQTDKGQVERALADFTGQRSGVFAPLAATDEVDEDELLLIAASLEGHVTVFYPANFTAWDEASQYLSATLQKAVFSFHIHDSDLWMYRFSVNGQEVDRFNPVPDYWEELSEAEHESWAGNAATVSQHWPHVSESQIVNYLVPWDLDEDEDDGPKAYPEDEYSAGEEWQLLDFMTKLGLVYPMDEQGNYLGAKYHFKVK